MADLEKPEKTLVFRQNEELSANDLLDLRAALTAYGPATLLWVQEARPGRPAGSVSIIDDTLIVGYVTRLAKRGNAPDLDLQSWMMMLRNAHEVRPPRATLPPQGVASPIRPLRRKRVDIVFGCESNAAACTGDGWSKPEDGFTWSIEDRSALIIGRLEAADSYRLQMNVGPFVAPPAVMAQTMSVAVNGTLVHTFDPVPRGEVECSVPGRLISGHDTTEMILGHPAAISPKDALGHKDDRRLAVAFHRLSVICN